MDHIDHATLQAWYSEHPRELRSLKARIAEKMEKNEHWQVSLPQ